jgi:hypothetical protein
MMSLLRASQFRLEKIDGKLRVSAQIATDEGNLLVELIRNDCKVAPAPGTWDKNDDDNALEVKNPKGIIVLQVVLLPDRVQIQGIWPTEFNGESGWYVAIKQNPLGQDGAQYNFLNPHSKQPWPRITPLFKYPSDKYLGEGVN